MRFVTNGKKENFERYPYNYYRYGHNIELIRNMCVNRAESFDVNDKYMKFRQKIDDTLNRAIRYNNMIWFSGKDYAFIKGLNDRAESIRAERYETLIAKH